MARVLKSNEKMAGGRRKHLGRQSNEIQDSGAAGRKNEVRLWETLILQVVSTLPDSITQREAILEALLGLVPCGHHCGPGLRLLQVHLEEHCRLQQNWFQHTHE